MNRILASLFVFALLLAQTPVSFAQDASSPDVPAATAPNEPVSAGPLNCSDYYHFGSVEADLQPTVEQTVPGTPITFVGAIKNANSYPLLDGTLSVRIFKRDETTFKGGDGNLIVDQFVIKDGITLRANGEEKTTFVWQVPRNAEAGDYYAAYFFTTHKRYGLMGLPFNDDVVGNQAPFAITAPEADPIAKLSKKDTTLKGQDHVFTGLPLYFEISDEVTVSTSISNDSAVTKTLPLQWNQYAWDSTNKDNLRHSKTEVVTILANSEKKVTYTAQKQVEGVVYVTAVTQDIETKSFINVLYIREGSDETRLSFSGLSNFPIAKNSQATLVACAHATNIPAVPGNVVTLSLKDRDGKILHEYRYEGDIAGAMSGFGESFTPASNVNYATLTTTLERGGVVVDEVTQTYDCEAIDPATCFPEEGLGGFLDFIKTYFLPIILTGVIILLIAAIIVYLKKRPRREHIDAGTSTTAFLFLLLMLPSLFFLTFDTASAQQGPCILGPEEVVGGQDGFADQSGGSACIARNFIEPPTGALTDHQSGSFYGGCGVLREGDMSSIGGCISRVDTFNPPSSRCEVYGHYCVQGGGAGGNLCSAPPQETSIAGQCNDWGYDQLIPKYQGNDGYFLWTEATNQGTNVGECIQLKPAQVDNEVLSAWKSSSCVSTSCGPIGYTATTFESFTTLSQQCQDQGFTVLSESAFEPEGGQLGDLGKTQGCLITRDLNPEGPFGGGYQYAWYTNPSASCTALPTSCTPAGSLYTWNGLNWDDYSPFSEPLNWEPGTIGIGMSQPPSGDWVNGQAMGYGVVWQNNALRCGASSNAPPNPPAINGQGNGGSSNGIVNLDLNLEFLATDPESDNILYGIDWDNTGEDPDQWLPGDRTTVPSGTVLSDMQTYLSEGSYTFRAFAVDSNGNRSGWTSHTVNVGSPITQCSYDIVSNCVEGRCNDLHTVRTSFGSGQAETIDVWDQFTIEAIVGGVRQTLVTRCDAEFPGFGNCMATQSFTINGHALSVDVLASFTPSGINSSEMRGTGDVQNCTYQGISADLKINDSTGPLTVTRGTPLAIEWSSTNAASCSAFWQPGVPIVAPSGTDSQSASVSMDYMINCGGALASVTVTIVNAPPNAPAITHQTGSADFNALTTFSIQGSDPDGDNVFYEVDWNPNDSIDFDTNTPDGPNNSIQTASHAFSTAGRNTIRARTVDTSGATSGWTTYDININQAPAPVATLEVAVNGGSFSTGDQTVNPGDTISIRWDSSNASSCAGSGSGFDTGGRTNGTDGVNTPAPNSQTTFTATCTGPGGERGTSLTITVRQLPNLSQPNITYQLSTGFDLATGAYNYVDIFFNTSNNGGSDTRASADYRFEFDSGRNGYELTRTGSLGLFTVGQTVPRTERVQGPIIFGDSRVRVTVDSTDVVTETDETDNDRSVDITFVPPDPELSITADRTQLREGEATRIRWSRRASYPLDCTVSGPNMLVENAAQNDERPTAPIMAKSVFTFTCIEPITGTEFSTSVSVESAGTIEET